jgi:hypothetical protein
MGRLGILIASALIVFLVSAQAQIPAVNAIGASTSSCAYSSCLRTNMVPSPTIHVQGWHGPGTPGGGDFEYVGGTCTDNSGTIIEDAGNNCYERNVQAQGVIDDAWFGAYNDAQQRNDCAVSGSPAVVSCTGYHFVSSDVGKAAAFLQAGSAVTGGQTATLVGTIYSVASNNATLTVNTRTAVASSGVFAFGHDDTAAINAADAAGPSFTAQGSGPSCDVLISGGGTLVTSNLAIGGSTGCPALVGTQRTPIYCAISAENTGLSGTDCITLTGAGSAGSGENIEDVKPTRLEKILVDAMDTGRDCVVLTSGTDPVIRDVVINNCWMDGLALKVTSNWTDIKQALIENVSISFVGLHCVYLDAVGTNQFINDNTAINLHCANPSLNGAAILAAAGGPAAPWSSWSSGNKTTYNPQLGAAIYVMDQSIGDAGFYRFTCASCIFIAHATLAQSYGSNINPNVVVLADGSESHAIEGAGIPDTGVGYNQYTQFHFMNGESENLAGAAPGGGFQFFAESPAMVTNFANLLFGGAANWSAGLGDNFDTNANGDLTYVPNVGGYAWGFWGGDFGTNAPYGSSPIATSSIGGMPRVPVMQGEWSPSGNTYNLTNTTGMGAVIIDETDHKFCWYEPGNTDVECATGSPP